MEDMARLALVEQYLKDPNNCSNVLYELHGVINKILENPHDYDLRTIKNDTVEGHAKSAPFRDYLKYIGFKVENDKISYPKKQTLSKLRIALVTIERKIGFCCGQLLQNSNNQSGSSTAQARKPKQTPLRVLTTTNSLLIKIETLFNNMIQYEDEEVQQLARNAIPILPLQLQAIDRLREHQSQIKKGEIEAVDMPFDIAMLMELMYWYKHHFFMWVDKPECDGCSGDTKFIFSTRLQTDREVCVVETYECTRCRNRLTFPRFNDLRTLLRTRRGRCGEWANCFTLMCRALGYDTRYVYDTTDHVWCEIYDYDSNTWLHVDPCEGKIDAPLMYSHGWGKKLSYVIAFSRDDLQDVTWRYTTNHKEVLKRRTQCSEEELISTILLLRERRQHQLSAARIKYLTKRNVEELAQFLGERKPGDGERHGRISGSTAWKMERGETGRPIPRHTFVFTKPGNIEIRYYPVADEYRIWGPQPAVLHSWSAGAHEIHNVFRKRELDWKYVYLARKINESLGVVSWRISADPGKVFSLLTVYAVYAVFNGGEVKWELEFDGEKMDNVHFGAKPVTIKRRFTTATIVAKLGGGSGELAWQHSQLFRLSTTSPTPAFKIITKLENSIEPKSSTSA